MKNARSTQMRRPQSVGSRGGPLRKSGAVLLISCYELGHQPHGITLPKAFLERAGFAPAAMDLAVEGFDAARVERALFVAISVPMHTALRIGEGVARRIRTTAPDAHICFHGHYAILHGERLRNDGFADSVLGGEVEARLVELVESLVDGTAEEAAGSQKATQQALGASVGRQAKPPLQATPPTFTSPSTKSASSALSVPSHTAPAAVLEALEFAVPSRQSLPSLDRYAHLVHGDKHVVAGYTEASRGCLHRCRHCPIPAVYDGRLFIVPRDVVLQDVRRQVDVGARHITFGDADFLNGPTHAVRVARALHDEFPEVTFDFTAKVEHIVRHPEVLRELAALGAVFMVSAVETLSDRVLSILDKGHTRRDVFAALTIAREAGVALRPSLLPFTPWSTKQDFIELLDWVESEDLVEHVDAVQFTIRLLVPPGSLLLAHPEMRPHLGEFDPEHLTYRWRHPDPEMDALQRELAELVEECTARGDDAQTAFKRIRAHADAALNVPPRRVRAATRKEPRRRHQSPPRLTESWFC